MEHYGIKKLKNIYVTHKYSLHYSSITTNMNNNGINNTKKEQTTPNVFDLKMTLFDLCLTAPPKYSIGDNVTVSSKEFLKRLNTKLGKYFKIGFDWSNILLAGGLISGLLESQMDPIEYELSDIDLFVYGSKSKVISKLQEIYDYFTETLDKKFYAFVYKPNTPIFSIIIPGGCAIQVIGTNFSDEMEVLESFDLTHCQVGFNGNKLVCTDEFVQAIKTRVTKITKKSIHAYRLVKTYNRGYSIDRPTYCYIKNIFHNYTHEPGKPMIPRNTDKYYDINQLQNIIDELSKNPIVIQNMTKNYIPPVNNELTPEENQKIMDKIGELYAGKDQYHYVNDNCFGHFESDIRNHFHFVRMPFLC